MARDTTKVAEWVLEKYEKLSSGRKNYETLCQDVTEYFAPNRDDFIQKQPIGANRLKRVYHPIGVECVEKAAADLYGLLTDPSGNWFEYAFDSLQYQMSPSMIVWLRRQSEVVFEKMYASRARAAEAIARTYYDDLTYGTSILYISWNRRDNCPLYQNLRLSECFFSEDEAGRPDTLIRLFEMDVKSIKRIYPAAVLPDNIKKEIEKNETSKKHEIIHAVFPNDEYSQSLSKKPFVSMIMLKEDKTVLEVSGYDEFPFAITRWETAPGEVWGRSRAMTALPDVKSLQLMTKEMLESAQLANRPMMFFKSEEQKLSVPVIRPGGYGVYEEEPPVPFNAGNNYRAALEVIQNIEERVRHEFALYKINDLQGTHRTREEILQRILEGTRLLGPIAGRQMAEKLDVILLRTFNLCVRHGAIEPPPEDVPFFDLKVVYNSPIAKMMKFERASRYEQAFGSMAPLLQVNPQAIDNLDTDAVLREIAQIFGVPELLKPYEEVIQQRQIAAQQAAQAQNVQDAGNALTLQNMQNQVLQGGGNG